MKSFSVRLLCFLSRKTLWKSSYCRTTTPLTVLESFTAQLQRHAKARSYLIKVIDKTTSSSSNRISSYSIWSKIKTLNQKKSELNRRPLFKQCWWRIDGNNSSLWYTWTCKCYTVVASSGMMLEHNLNFDSWALQKKHLPLFLTRPEKPEVDYSERRYRKVSEGRYTQLI